MFFFGKIYFYAKSPDLGGPFGSPIGARLTGLQLPIGLGTGTCGDPRKVLNRRRVGRGGNFHTQLAIFLLPLGQLLVDVINFCLARGGNLRHI